MDLVFDRTYADVLQGNEKGFYTEKDLNRVETAVQQLQQMAQQLGISIQLQTKTDWDFTAAYSAQNWPTKAQMDRYIYNVARLSRSCGVNAVLPESMDRLDWEGANQIESALYQTYLALNSALQAN